LLILVGVLPNLPRPWFKYLLHIPAFLAIVFYLSMASLADNYASLYKIVLRRFNPWDPLFSIAYVKLDFLIISIGAILVITTHLLSLLIMRVSKSASSAWMR